MGNFKVPSSARSLSMHDSVCGQSSKFVIVGKVYSPFRDTFTCKMSKCFNELSVLEENETTATTRLVDAV
jgi:hypothetical protein